MNASLITTFRKIKNEIQKKFFRRGKCLISFSVAFTTFVYKLEDKV